MEEKQVDTKVMVAGHSRRSLGPYFAKIEPILARAERGSIITDEEIEAAAGIPVQRLAGKIVSWMRNCRRISITHRGDHYYLRTNLEQSRRVPRGVKKIIAQARRSQMDQDGVDIIRLSPVDQKIHERQGEFLHDFQADLAGHSRRIAYIVGSRKQLGEGNGDEK